jgi:cysteinyl-tRNA synthetase
VAEDPRDRAVKIYRPITAIAVLAILVPIAALLECGPVPLQRLGGCQPNPCEDIADPGLAAFASGVLPGDNWMYQLQDASASSIEATAFQIAVIDYSRDGEEGGRYSDIEMTAMKSGGSRTVLAYLSIGEAEDYRYYFDPRWTSWIEGQPTSAAPCWLGRTNPDWEGNYKVQYWSEDWQRIVLGYVDRIIEDGFDGVYLDIIDAFEYWGDRDNGEGYWIEESLAAERMIGLVGRIARHARVEKGKTDFYIIPQNGERIFDYDSSGTYFDTISGIGIEDLYYDGTAAIPAAGTAERNNLLSGVKSAGKPVLVVDYVDRGIRPTPEAIVADFLNKASADGYIPYAARADRELDEINVFAGQP